MPSLRKATEPEPKQPFTTPGPPPWAFRCCYCGRKSKPFVILHQYFTMFGDPYEYKAGRETYMCKQCVEQLGEMVRP